MTPADVFAALQEMLGAEVVFDFHADPKKDRDPWFQVDAQGLHAVASLLKNDARFAVDTLECLTGVDYPDKQRIVVVYHFYSHAHRHRIIAKAYLPREAPSIGTLSALWSVALWQERECYDLLGVRFEGHPDLRRVLLPDDWEGHPLRKDYAENSAYHGIPTVRQNPLELFQIGKAPAAKA
jgi:NADH-quinone oxidoreductase subunit C